MSMFYSAGQNSLYPDALRESREATGDWPADAKEISDALYHSLLGGQSNGKVITADSNGNPILTEPVIDWDQKAELQRQSLITAANKTISFLQTKLLAGRELTHEQKTALNAWLDYTDKLDALDFTDLKNVAGFEAIEWPDKPE